MSGDAWQNLAQRLDSNAVRLYRHPDRRLAEIGRDCALAAELIRSVDLNINRGGNMNDELMGDTVDVVARTYAHLLPRDLARAAANIDASVGEG